LHGFRTTLATWVEEQTNFREKLVKRQIDHVAGDATHESYFRSQLLEKRRVMTEAWGEHCTRPTPAAGTNVTQFKRRRIA
jgi:hypothetical protein